MKFQKIRITFIKKEVCLRPVRTGTEFCQRALRFSNRSAQLTAVAVQIPVEHVHDSAVPFSKPEDDDAANLNTNVWEILSYFWDKFYSFATEVSSMLMT